MAVNKNDIYAFDECSILKLCKIRIPVSYKVFFEESSFAPRNHGRLRKLIFKLDEKKIPKYKFIPGNFETNAIKLINEIIESKQYNIRMLGESFRAQLLDQFEEFYCEIKEEFIGINKVDTINYIKDVFLKNEKDLTKERNIPEDDDFSIIAGYIQFSHIGRKHIISEDEHFWGYSDLILHHFKIIVVRECNCEELLQPS